VGATPSAWNFGSNWLRWSKIADFQSIFTSSTSAVTPSDKSSINTNRKSTTRFPMSLRWTLYVASEPPLRAEKQNGRFLCKIAQIHYNVRKILSPSSSLLLSAITIPPCPVCPARCGLSAIAELFVLCICNKHHRILQDWVLKNFNQNSYSLQCLSLVVLARNNNCLLHCLRRRCMSYIIR